MFLLDTDVVSRTSPASAGGGAALTRWFREHAARSYISVVTLGEMQFGVSRLLERGAHRKAARLLEWIAIVENDFFERCLSLDAVTARRAGELLARAEARGVKPNFEDAYIAAAADLRGLVVITFNARHFRAFGIPFDSPVGRGGETA